jgi:hypothetical protein
LLFSLARLRFVFSYLVRNRRERRNYANTHEPYRAVESLLSFSPLTEYISQSQSICSV